MRSLSSLVTLAIVLVLAIALMQSAQAQVFTVLHSFTGGGDGADPAGGLTMDAAGNLYGTTSEGALGCGTVFKLAYKNSKWVLNTLYTFKGGNDGCGPGDRVAIGGDGSLYGTTTLGGGPGCGGNGCGTIFNLRPAPGVCKAVLCPWSETVLYRFAGSSDGAFPQGDPILDQAGNLYDTAGGGGYAGGNCASFNPPGCGVVFELEPSNGGWTETVLYSFTGGVDGLGPAGVVFDTAGNLYGANFGSFSGGNDGIIYELERLDPGWALVVIHALQMLEGGDPHGSLAFDPIGNLYGTTCCEGPYTFGSVYELTPSNGGWSFSVIYGFPGGGGIGPSAGVTLDSAGNLYGTTFEQGAYGGGTVYELTKGDWQYQSLHTFTTGDDGALPLDPVLLDRSGNLYGTAYEGGNLGCDAPYGCGVVWEITPQK